MSLSSANNRNDYTGTGALDEYDYTFKIFREEDLLVTVRDTDGIESTLVLNTDYTVDGVGDVGGGTITLLDGDLADDYILTIRRVLELKQSTDIRNQGAYFPVLHENQFDKHIMIAQQQQDELDRALKLPETVSGDDVDTTLPIPVAGRTIGWNGDADGLSNFANAGDLEVSAYIETVLDDTSSIVARDTLRTRGIIHVGDYGAVGDGTTNDAAAITSAIAAASSSGKVLYGASGKTYRIESNVNFRYIKVDFSDCDILVVGAAVKVIAGGNAQSGHNPTQKFREVTRSGGGVVNPIVQIIGAKGQQIHVEYCPYVQLYADTEPGDSGPDTSCAYSTFYFDFVGKLVITTNAATPNSLVQWINENTFYLKRTESVLMEGTYGHNGNIFHTGCFEGGSSITIDDECSSNIFMGVRFEGNSADVVFGADAYNNQIYGMWASNEDVPYNNAGPADTVTDPSGRNYVTFMNRLLQYRIPIMELNPHTCETYAAGTAGGRANWTSIKGVDVQRYGIDTFTRDSFRPFYDSPRIPVSVGDVIKFDADVALFRYTVQLFTTAGVKMTEATHPNIATYLDCSAGLAWDNSTDQYEMSANNNDMKARVTHSDVGYVKWDMIMGNGTDSTAFRHARLTLITSSINAANWAKAQGNRQQPAAVSSSPTRGFASEIGTKVSNTAGGWFTCTFSLDTTVNGDEASGQTVITVTTATGINSGDIVGVVLDSGLTHWTTVNGAPSGSNVTLTVALPSAAASGSRFVVNRWTAS